MDMSLTTTSLFMADSQARSPAVLKGSVSLRRSSNITTYTALSTKDRRRN